MGLLIKILMSALSVFIAAQVLPGVEVDNFVTAILVSLVLGLMNTIVKPILVILTLPITVITLGLFTFVLNALLILLTSWLVSGFKVDGFIYALLFSLVLSIINFILQSFTK